MAIMNTLLHTKINIMFLDFYGKYTIPEIKKANDIPNNTHRHKKFLQDMDQRRKGGIYWGKKILDHNNYICNAIFFTSQDLLYTSTRMNRIHK